MTLEEAGAQAQEEELECWGARSMEGVSPVGHGKVGESKSGTQIALEQERGGFCATCGGLGLVGEIDVKNGGDWPWPCRYVARHSPIADRRP